MYHIKQGENTQFFVCFAAISLFTVYTVSRHWYTVCHGLLCYGFVSNYRQATERKRQKPIPKNIWFLYPLPFGFNILGSISELGIQNVNRNNIITYSDIFHFTKCDNDDSYRRWPFILISMCTPSLLFKLCLMVAAEKKTFSVFDIVKKEREREKEI